MAISRGSMTKEMVGGKKKTPRKMAMGGMAPPGRSVGKPSGMMGGMPPRGMAPPMAGPVTPPGRSVGKPSGLRGMKSGGKVGRGDGIATKGKTKGAMC
jgi:hypothetical protein